MRSTTSGPRCPWAKTELSIAYHDDEWGVPLHGDDALFGLLVLEGAQAGLSWETHFPSRVWPGRRTQSRLPSCRCRYRSESSEDPCRDHQCASDVEHPTRVRFSGCPPLELRRREADRQPVSAPREDPGANASFRRPQHRASETRFPLCGINDLLCFHAVVRVGERSSRALLSS